MRLRRAAIAALLFSACQPSPPPIPDAPPRSPEPSGSTLAPAPPPSVPDETSDDAVCKAIHAVLKVYPGNLREIAGARLPSIAEPQFASKITVPGATEAYLALPEAPLKPRWQARWENEDDELVKALADHVGRCASLKNWVMARGDAGEVKWTPPGGATALVKIYRVAVGVGIVFLTVGIEE
jgi:hypothetical protein